MLKLFMIVMYHKHVSLGQVAVFGAQPLIMDTHKTYDVFIKIIKIYGRNVFLFLAIFVLFFLKISLIKDSELPHSKKKRKLQDLNLQYFSLSFMNRRLDGTKNI
jgi:hypothetical protein